MHAKMYANLSFLSRPPAGVPILTATELVQEPFFGLRVFLFARPWTRLMRDWLLAAGANGVHRLNALP